MTVMAFNLTKIGEHAWVEHAWSLSSMGRKGNLAVFQSSNISETREVTPTKIGVHVCYINTYLLDFFELIPIH